MEAFSVLKWRTSALRCAPLAIPVADASASRVRFWCDHCRNGIDVALLTLRHCLGVLGCCEERSFVFASSTSVLTLLRRLRTSLSGPKLWARVYRARVLHALSIQGVCKHSNDQVCMSGRLQVHGCVRPIHTIVPFTPDGLVQCMHDAAIR